ncbi:MAG: adenosine deaminase [Bacillota bacterium]|nr:adenosine deaminase [Bacillota bacterium]
MEKIYGMIDLHLHLDGSLSVDSVRKLAALQNMEIPQEEDALRRMLQVREGCRDLNEYLEKFAFPCSLMQTKEGIAGAVQHLEAELAEAGMLYAELRFAPQQHTEKGLTQREVVAAAISGMGRSGLRSNLILCCMRGTDNREKNLETIHVAKEFLHKGVAAADLAGAEALFPTEGFGELFALARELGVPYTIHAGEAAGPESIGWALEFGTKRVGHGVRALEDEAMVKRLAAEGITLELCPTSNLHTSMFDSYEEYPLRKLMEAGVRVTVNTDNMAVSGTTVSAELKHLQEALQLTEQELRLLAETAAEASFADAETKEWMKTEIAKRFA